MWTKAVAFIPNLFGALLFLLAGWIVARFVRFLIQRALHAMKLDLVAEKAGIHAALKEANLSTQPSVVVSKLVYWGVMVLALVMAVNVLKLTVATELLNRLLL